MRITKTWFKTEVEFEVDDLSKLEAHTHPDIAWGFILWLDRTFDIPITQVFKERLDKKDEKQV